VITLSPSVRVKFVEYAPPVTTTGVPFTFTVTAVGAHGARQSPGWFA
jgi:hypothetical protein